MSYDIEVERVSLKHIRTDLEELNVIDKYEHIPVKEVFELYIQIIGFEADKLILTDKDTDLFFVYAGNDEVFKA